MVRHLETVRQRANAEGFGSRLALLGITLDPVFDTSAVLRAYGESVLKGPDRFDQWTLATGTVGQIEDVARFFGVDSAAAGSHLDQGRRIRTLRSRRVARARAGHLWCSD